MQALPARDPDEPFTNAVGKAAGFSLHAGVAAQAHQREKLERLCRYIARPALSEKRLSLTGQGNIRYALKTPYRAGPMHVLFEPLEFIARLVALIPKPRVNLTRYHGVLAPNSHRRAQVIRGQRARRTGEETDTTAAAGPAAMTWAQRLKRVFKIDIETCSHGGRAVKIIAGIEDPAVIETILTHLNKHTATAKPAPRHESRAPPQTVLLDAPQETTPVAVLG